MRRPVTRPATALAFLLLALVGLRANEAGTDSLPEKPSIRVLVNPEGRVSVTEIGAVPDVHSGVAAAIPVRIVNQGFVTGLLEAELVGNTPPWVAMEFHPERLKGLPAETRILRLTVGRPGTVDISIAFRTHTEAPDLGGRDRIHFLVRSL
jgi:hypothetical protein